MSSFSNPALLFARFAILCTLGSSALRLPFENVLLVVSYIRSWENNAFFASLFRLSARVCKIDNVTRIS